MASLPISYVRDLGADVVIASDVNFDGARFFEDPKTAMGVLTHTFVAVERIVANQHRGDADVLITPKVGHIRWDQTRRADELLQAGYDVREAPAVFKHLMDEHGASRYRAVAVSSPGRQGMRL